MDHHPPYTDSSCRWDRRLPLLFSLWLLALVTMTGQARANPDVYAALPEDTRVIQYGMGDCDGDSREELAVLYTSDGKVRITLFQAESGRWSRWWEDDVSLVEMDRASPSSLELVDINGDGRDEILIYYLAEDGTALLTRSLALDTSEPANTAFRIILEDMTAPPGYPLFGSENGVSSVTFLKIPLESDDRGYRRVYCWDGGRFEKCVEVPWEKP